MSKQENGINKAKFPQPKRLLVWHPHSEADYLRVFEHGPRSCMSLDRSQCFIQSDEEFNEIFDTRWDPYSFYYKNWHPGLFYHDCPDVRIICLVDENNLIRCRANVWNETVFGSLYGEYTELLRGYLIRNKLKTIQSTPRSELALYSVLGRHIRIQDKDHYLLPWAFCDDWTSFAERPNVGFDDATKRFLVSTKPIPNGLTIHNDYAFEGFISTWDIQTTWKTPRQGFADIRKKTAAYWNSLHGE